MDTGYTIQLPELLIWDNRQWPKKSKKNCIYFVFTVFTLLEYGGGSGTKCRTSRRLSVVLDIFH